MLRVCEVMAQRIENTYNETRNTTAYTSRNTWKLTPIFFVFYHLCHQFVNSRHLSSEKPRGNKLASLLNCKMLHKKLINNLKFIWSSNKWESSQIWNLFSTWWTRCHCRKCFWLFDSQSFRMRSWNLKIVIPDNELKISDSKCWVPFCIVLQLIFLTLFRSGGYQNWNLPAVFSLLAAWFSLWIRANLPE